MSAPLSRAARLAAIVAKAAPAVAEYEVAHPPKPAPVVEPEPTAPPDPE
jgi:hypothetical protein